MSSLALCCVLTPHCINIRHAGLQYQHLAGAHSHRRLESTAHCSTEPLSPGHHMQLQTETPWSPAGVLPGARRRWGPALGTSLDTTLPPAGCKLSNTNISTFCHRLRTLGHIFQQYINLSSTPQYYCHKEEFLPYHNDGLLRQGFRIKFLLHVSQLRVSTIAHLIVTRFLLLAAGHCSAVTDGQCRGSSSHHTMVHHFRGKWEMGAIEAAAGMAAALVADAEFPVLLF